MVDENSNKTYSMLNQLFDWVDSLSISNNSKVSFKSIVLIDFFDTWQIDYRHVKEDYLYENKIINEDFLFNLKITYGIVYPRQLEVYFIKLYHRLSDIEQIDLKPFPFHLLDFNYGPFKSDHVEENIKNTTSLEILLKNHFDTIINQSFRIGDLKESLSQYIISDDIIEPNNTEAILYQLHPDNLDIFNDYFDSLNQYFNNWIDCTVSLEDWLDHKNVDVLGSIDFLEIFNFQKENIFTHQSILYKLHTKNIFIQSYKNTFHSNDYQDVAAIKHSKLLKFLINNQLTPEIEYEIQNNFKRLDNPVEIISHIQNLLSNNFPKLICNDINSNFCFSEAEAILMYDKFLNEYLQLNKDESFNKNSDDTQTKILKSTQLFIDDLKNFDYYADTVSYFKKHTADEEDYEFSFFINDYKYDRLYEDTWDLYKSFNDKAETFNKEIIQKVLFVGNYTQLEAISKMLSLAIDFIESKKQKFIVGLDKPSISRTEKRSLENMMIPIAEIKLEISQQLFDSISSLLNRNITSVDPTVDNTPSNIINNLFKEFENIEYFEDKNTFEIWHSYKYGNIYNTEEEIEEGNLYDDEDKFFIFDKKNNRFYYDIDEFDSELELKIDDYIKNTFRPLFLDCKESTKLNIAKELESLKSDLIIEQNELNKQLVTTPNVSDIKKIKLPILKVKLNYIQKLSDYTNQRLESTSKKESPVVYSTLSNLTNLLKSFKSYTGNFFQYNEDITNSAEALKREILDNLIQLSTENKLIYSKRIELELNPFHQNLTISEHFEDYKDFDLSNLKSHYEATDPDLKIEEHTFLNAPLNHSKFNTPYYIQRKSDIFNLLVLVNCKSILSTFDYSIHSSIIPIPNLKTSADKHPESKNPVISRKNKVLPIAYTQSDDFSPSTLNKTYKALLDKLIHADTIFDDFESIFYNQKPSTPIVWIGGIESLCYFIKQIHLERKLIKQIPKNIWKVSLELFVDENGNKFTTIKSQQVPSNQNTTTLINNAIDFIDKEILYPNRINRSNK